MHAALARLRETVGDLPVSGTTEQEVLEIIVSGTPSKRPAGGDRDANGAG